MPSIKLLRDNARIEWQGRGFYFPEPTGLWSKARLIQPEKTPGDNLGNLVVRFSGRYVVEGDLQPERFAGR